MRHSLISQPLSYSALNGTLNDALNDALSSVLNSALLHEKTILNVSRS